MPHVYYNPFEHYTYLVEIRVKDRVQRSRVYPRVAALRLTLSLAFGRFRCALCRRIYATTSNISKHNYRHLKYGVLVVFISFRYFRHKTEQFFTHTHVQNLSAVGNNENCGL